MVIHTQIICRQQPTNCLIMFEHFVGLALKRLKSGKIQLVAYGLSENFGATDKQTGEFFHEEKFFLWC